MEDFDVMKKVREKRTGTQGEVRSVEDIPEEAIAKKREQAAASKQEKTTSEAAAEQQTAPEQAKAGESHEIQKGIVVGTDQNGRMVMQMIGKDLNTLELIGLLEYTNKKKQEVTGNLSNSHEAVTSNKINSVEKTIADIAKTLSVLTRSQGAILNTMLSDEQKEELKKRAQESKE